MLRSLLYYLVFIPWTLVMSLTSWIAPRSAHGVHRFVHRAWTGVGLWAAGVRLDVDLGSLTPGQTCIFMANHQSLFDILILYQVLKPWDVRFVAKESLFEIPVFGPAMAKAGHVAIDRDNMRKAMKAIEAAVAEVQAGRSLVVFPEGTRSLNYAKLQEFKVGGMILALKTGKPIVPLVLSGSGEIKPKTSPFIRGGVVRVHALPAIDPGRYTMKERETLRTDLESMMETAYQELRHGA